MDKNKMIKITLDTILMILLLVLMDSTLTGTNLHEWLGFLIFALFLAHIYLNRKFISQVLKNAFKKNTPLQPKIMLTLSTILLLCVTGITVTGLFISENYTPLFGINNFSFWFPIHVSISSFTLLLVAVHIGLHWKALFTLLKHSLGMVKTTKFQSIFLKFSALLVVIFGIRGMEQSQIMLHAFVPFANSNKEEVPTAWNPPRIRNENYIPSNNHLSLDANVTEYQTSFIDYHRKHGHGRGEWQGEYRENENYGNFNEENQEQFPNLTENEEIQEILQNTPCTLCDKGCNLLNPDCGKGRQLQQQLIQQYSVQNNEEPAIESFEEENPLLDDDAAESDLFPNMPDSSNEQPSINDSIDNVDPEEKLGNTICTLCDKGCTLLNPQCNRGAEEAQRIIQQYNETGETPSAIGNVKMTNQESPIVDYMMSMGLVITSTYYISEALHKRKRKNHKSKIFSGEA